MGITYRAAYVGDADLTSIEHAGWSDQELLAEGIAEARRSGLPEEDMEAVQVGEWTSLDRTVAGKIGRAAQCAACGCAGIHVDTDAGEIVVAGHVVATVAGETLLLVDERGALTCDDCAETLEREAGQAQRENRATVEALAAEDAPPSRRRWHTPDMAEAAGRAVRLDAIADGHDESAEDCWEVWLDSLDEDEADTLCADEEIRAAFARGWATVEAELIAAQDRQERELERLERVRYAGPALLDALRQIRDAVCSGMGLLPAEDIERAEAAIRLAEGRQ